MRERGILPAKRACRTIDEASPVVASLTLIARASCPAGWDCARADAGGNRALTGRPTSERSALATALASPLSRRSLVAFACACCAPRALAATAGVLDTTEVAPGIHFRRGADADAASDNADAIANTGFIVGREAVAVIDPGGSLADGQSLLATVRAATELPIRYVILSHVHPDHIFGAGACLPERPVVVGHAQLPASLAQRGEYYQRRLDEVLGPGSAGPVVAPTLLVQDRTELDLGGRVLELTAHSPAHTDTDLSILDRQTGTLLLADLLFVRRVPSLDGSLKGWLGKLERLRKTRPARIVPGHGPLDADQDAALADLGRYLETLARETRAAIAKGMPIEDAVQTVAAGERDRWLLFDDYNGRNVTQAYRELEWE
jgi:quinoprotein relay system zinc metallohydrolase 2